MPVPRWLPLPLLALASLIATGDPGAVAPSTAALVLAPGQGKSCPLTIGQEKVAFLAFEEMMPVIRHPRCNNCHGGIDPLVPYKQGGHVGDLDTSTIAHNSVQTRRAACQECHSELPGWDTPGDPMMWNGKTTKQICMQFKAFSSDPAEFIAHVTEDAGGIQFIAAGFKGERALDDASKDYVLDKTGTPFVVEKPPGTQQDLIRQGTTWANAVGPQGWNATPECGCEVRKNSWGGTATAVMKFDGGQYSVEEKATATVYFELEENLSRGVPQEYWKSTEGHVTWEVTYSGQCNAHFSGTTPIVVGGDGNPMALIQLSPESGGLRYSASLAPWQERYYPVKTIPCKDSPPLETQLPRFAGEFWRHDPMGGLVTQKGTLIEGSYEVKMRQAVQRWTWSFRRMSATKAP